MNILVSSLPNEIEGHKIRTDFRIMVNFELLICDDLFTWSEKMVKALEMFYEDMPDDIETAIEGLQWFYRCGEESTDNGQERGKSEPCYDFNQDAAYIYAAFWQQYGIDLNTAKLHWWKFRALFSGLSDDTQIVKIMGYRTADTKGMSKEQKKAYNKMKAQFALKKRNMQKLSTEARNNAMKDYVRKRFEEAGKG